MELGILATGIFAMLCVMIILYGAKYETQDRSEKRNAFSTLSLVILMSMIVNVAAYMPLDWSRYSALKFVLTMLNLASPFGVFLFFLQYIFLHITISNPHNVPGRSFSIGFVYCYGCILYTLLGSVTGKLFTIEGGRFTVGSLFDQYLLLYVVLMLLTLAILVRSMSSIGVHDTMAGVSFVLFPSLGLMLTLADRNYSFGIPSLAPSLLLLYITVQGEREQNLVFQEKISKRMAHMDPLTGMQNRLAFDETRLTMNGHGPVGVVFADINGLKYTNDHFGHKAGDELLCSFSAMLHKAFRRSDYFRISGDEFVVIARGIPMDTFREKTDALTAYIKAREVPIAAVGFAYGKESEIGELLNAAENEMYADKEHFYQEYPNYCRK